MCVRLRRSLRSLRGTHFAPPTQRLVIAAVEKTHEAKKTRPPKFQSLGRLVKMASPPPPPVSRPHESEGRLAAKSPDAHISNGASKEGIPDYEDSHNSSHAQAYDSLEEYESYFSKIVISNSEETRRSASEDMNKDEEEEEEERLIPIDRLREFLDPGVLSGSVYPSHVPELRLLAEEAHSWLRRGTVGGRVGLDLGCGPMVQFPLLLSARLERLVMAHFLDQTRALLQTWLRDDRDNSLNLNATLAAVAQMAGKTPLQLKEQLRGRVDDVVSVDLFNRERGKFLPEKHDREGTYDVVVTSMLLEAVIQDLDTYAGIIKRVHGLLRRRGHLLMNGVLGMTYWDMRAGKFNCVTLSKESVEKVLHDAGFLDLEWTIVDREYYHSVSDYTKAFLVLARKP